MRKVVAFLLSLSLLSSQAGAFEGQAYDIIVNTQLNYDWSSVLVSKIRRFMMVNDMGDPFNDRIDETIVFDSEVGEYLNDESRELMNGLGNMVGLNLINTSTKFTLEGLNYKITDFKTDLKTTEDHADGISLAMDFSAGRVRLGADKITLGIVIPGMKGVNSPVLNIQIIDPIIEATHPELINFFAKIKIQDNHDYFKLLIEDSNFDQMAKILLEQPDFIKFRYVVIVPPVQLRIGSKTINFSPEKIKQLLVEKERGLKGLLLAQFSAQLAKGMGERALKIMESYKLKKDYWINSDIESLFKLLKFKSHVLENHVEVVSSGAFCSVETFKTHREDCTRAEPVELPPSRINLRQHLKSMRFMRDLINRSDAAVVVSASEDYVNKMLTSTYQAGLWNDTLKEYDTEIGPGKIVARMEERGETVTVYADIVRKLRGVHRAALGASEVRFPLAIKTSMKIIREGRIPVVVIRAEDVILDENHLLNGRPDLGMESNIKKLRLKKKVLAMIKADLGKIPGSELMRFEFPEFRGLGMEKAIFQSDGEGRMHAYLRPVDLSNDEN